MGISNIVEAAAGTASSVASAVATQFKIPGNIKQQFLPFVLRPGEGINTKGSDSSGLAGAQCFSFRSADGEGAYTSGYAKLQICPSSLTDDDFGSYFGDDVSHKLLFKDHLDDGMPKNGHITIDDIFNNMPGIQIREFLPDTKLDQCIDFFGKMIKMLKRVFGGGDSASENQVAGLVSGQGFDTNTDPTKEHDIAEWIKIIGKGIWEAFNYLIGGSTRNLFTDLNDKFKLGKGSVYGPDGETPVTLVHNFPYTLYYRLQSCTTTNVYVLPCRTDDMKMYASNGDAGWKGGWNSIKPFSKFPWLESIFKNVLGNVQVHFMPWWDARAGAETYPEDVTVKFDLFNDTAEAAMKNFVFVNTVVPNNMWIQYGMFQHSPCLYDVKLEGYSRLFACTGKFDVVGKGVLRNPSPSWVQKLCRTYMNTAYIDKKDFDDFIVANNLIKIPDVYQVSMTFSSLLPSNFNNFLYNYSKNNRLDTKYKNGKTYEPGLFGDIVKDGSDKFVSYMEGQLSEAKQRAQQDEISRKGAEARGYGS